MDKIHAMQVLSALSTHTVSPVRPKAGRSRPVQALENAMGTRLLHRTTRSMELTQAIKDYVA